MSSAPVAREVDVIVVGAGPSGLAAAAALARAGVGSVEVLEREPQAGGIPRHSHHTGYGLRDLHRAMTGPEYARHYADLAVSSGAEVRTSVAVTGWAAERTLETTAPTGRENLQARAIVLATGARERPRAARQIPGDRPRGVYTTGQLQQAVYGYNQSIGRRAVIVGAEHVSYSAAVTLHHAGAQVTAMLTGQPRQQSYAAFHLAARLRYQFPIRTRTRLARIIGHGHVEAVEIDGPGGMRTVECDTVVFTGDWVPDNELARRGGLLMAAPGGSPLFGADLHTSVPGVFAVGNLTHPVETADVVALEGAFAAKSVGRFLAGPFPHERSCSGVTVRALDPLLWAAPNWITPDGGAPHRDHVIVWTSAFTERPTWAIRQGERDLWVERRRHRAVPNRPIYLPAGWLARVDPEGPEVTITVVPS